MIRITQNRTPGFYEVFVSGQLTKDDYETIAIPALGAAISEHEHIRLLIQIDSAFTGMTLGALVDDAKLGLAHWNGFDRIALVADSGWITGSARAFSFLMPCPVQIFGPDQLEDARRWLSESLGAIHQTDLGQGVLHVQLRGKLDAAVYAEERGDLDAFIRQNDRFRMILDLRDFDGWQGLGAVGRHLSLVRDHAGLLDRAAIIGDAAWQKLAERVLGQTIKAETQYFTADQFEAAKRWISA